MFHKLQAQIRVCIRIFLSFRFQNNIGINHTWPTYKNKLEKVQTGYFDLYSNRLRLSIFKKHFWHFSVVDTTFVLYLFFDLYWFVTNFSFLFFFPGNNGFYIWTSITTNHGRVCSVCAYSGVPGASRWDLPATGPRWPEHMVLSVN